MKPKKRLSLSRPPNAVKVKYKLEIHLQSKAKSLSLSTSQLTSGPSGRLKRGRRHEIRLLKKLTGGIRRKRVSTDLWQCTTEGWTGQFVIEYSRCMPLPTKP